MPDTPRPQSPIRRTPGQADRYPSNMTTTERHDQAIPLMEQSELGLDFVVGHEWMPPTISVESFNRFMRSLNRSSLTESNAFESFMKLLRGEDETKGKSLWLDTIKLLSDDNTNTVGGNEESLYRPIAILLNIISVVYCLKNAVELDNNHKPILWLINSNSSLSGDLLNTKAKPDIIAGQVDSVLPIITYLEQLKNSNDDQLQKTTEEHKPCFSRLVSPVEVKSQLQEHHQVLHYLSIQLQYRLDVSSVYGVHAHRGSYRVVYLSPSCVRHSADYKWDQLGVLARYVAMVYLREKKRHSEFNQIKGAPYSWNVNIGHQEYFGEVFFAHYPLGRVTRALVVTSQHEVHKQPENQRVSLFKTYYADLTSRFREGELYNLAHGNFLNDGYIQGLAIPLSAEEYNSAYKVDGKTRRTKYSILLGSVGRPLSKCDSVLKLLKVIYDAVVTLEEMLKNGVMHRDINRGNVMCMWECVQEINGAPVWYKDSPYIEKVLSKVNRKDANSGGCHALIADLDHAENMNTESVNAGEGRTGTAMYISTELADTRFRYCRVAVEKARCAILQEDLQKILKSEACDIVFDNAFKDRVNQLGERKRFSDNPPDYPEMSKRQNKPHHDVESLFWVLVYALSRAAPIGEDDHEGQEDYSSFVCGMLSRNLAVSSDGGRIALIGGSMDWGRFLHSKLHGIIPALERLASIFSIPWSLHNTDGVDDFVHQAFKCILFSEIVRIIDNPGDNVIFDTENPRLATISKTMRATGIKLRKYTEKRTVTDDFKLISQSKYQGIDTCLEKRKMVVEDWINDERWMSVKPITETAARRVIFKLEDRSPPDHDVKPQDAIHW